jgi:hypothetical protein
MGMLEMASIFADCVEWEGTGPSLCLFKGYAGLCPAIYLVHQLVHQVYCQEMVQTETCPTGLVFGSNQTESIKMIIMRLANGPVNAVRDD